MSSSTTTAHLKRDGDATAKPLASADSDDRRRYSYDVEQLQKLRTDVPWMKDPKFFQKVALSPSALLKIMMHCQSGVEKGIIKGGNPIEVMGMLLGRPDPITPRTLVVTDAFPLPIEGFETRVIADDENVVNHMIHLGESLERTRNEKFMGWYHSHPFALSENSHCFLSQTDLSTQLQWQRAEDPHGNPFVAIVVDPLRSNHLQVPELKAFRAFPPEYNSPVANECPDGEVEASEQVRLEKWGSCWDRYYAMEMEFFMSSTSRLVLQSLTKNYLWMRTLLREPNSHWSRMLDGNAKSFQNVARAFAANDPMVVAAGSSTGTSGSQRGTRADPNLDAPSSKGGMMFPQTIARDPRTEELSKAANGLVETVAMDHLKESTLQATKKTIFG